MTIDKTWAEKAADALIALLLGIVTWHLTNAWFKPDSFLGEYVPFFLPLAVMYFSWKWLRKWTLIR